MQTISVDAFVILVALGANLPSAIGPPIATLRAALMELARLGSSPPTASRIFATTAWPDPHDPPFVNAVARIETKLEPPELLEQLHAIETRFGRQRGARNAPRTLDLDLIDYDGRIERGPPRLPHPRIEERGFVLVPLADIAPQWRHPVSGLMIADMIAALPREQRNLQVIE